MTHTSSIFLNKTTLFLTVFLVFTATQSFGQSQQVDATAIPHYEDAANGYSVVLPSWLQVMETGNSNAWGGTLPAVKNIQNAILIIAFNKSKFKDFEDFQRIYITGNTFGKATLFSEQHIFYGRNEKDFQKVPNGVASKLFLFYKQKIYHNQFVLLETSKAFLFINFTATPETYDENIPKFKQFLEGLKVN